MPNGARVGVGVGVNWETLVRLYQQERTHNVRTHNTITTSAGPAAMAGYAGIDNGYARQNSALAHALEARGRHERRKTASTPGPNHRMRKSVPEDSVFTICYMIDHPLLVH